MRIRLDQPVNASDGPFGDIGDVVIDPVTRTVTHLVVEPHRRHHLARLVPIDLVDAGEDSITIRLTADQIRALQSVADGDFVRLGEAIDLGDEWDVGIEHVVALPYTALEVATAYHPSGTVSISFDRIPKGECEIRRNSVVVSSDDHVVGHVDGLLVDETHIEGVIVRTGLLGFRRRVVVPVGSVDDVRNDCITIALDRRTFRRLRRVAELGRPGAARPEQAGDGRRGRRGRRAGSTER